MSVTDPSSSDAHQNGFIALILGAGLIAVAAAFFAPSWSPNAVASRDVDPGPTETTSVTGQTPVGIPDRVTAVLGGIDRAAVIEFDTFDTSLGPWRAVAGEVRDGAVWVGIETAASVGLLETQPAHAAPFAVVFKLSINGDDPDVQVGWERGAWQSSDFRRWGVSVGDDGSFRSNVWEGTEMWDQELVGAANAGTTYWVVLARQDGEMLAAVTPAAGSAQPTGIVRDAGWPDGEWAVVLRVFSGTVSVQDVWILQPAAR